MALCSAPLRSSARLNGSRYAPAARIYPPPAPHLPTARSFLLRPFTPAIVVAYERKTGKYRGKTSCEYALDSLSRARALNRDARLIKGERPAVTELRPDPKEGCYHRGSVMITMPGCGGGQRRDAPADRYASVYYRAT